MPTTYRATLRTRDGAPAAGAMARFAASPHEVTLEPGVAYLPEVVSATADDAGQITVGLVPGTYAVRIKTAAGDPLPTFIVAAAADPDIHDWLQLAEAP